MAVVVAAWVVLVPEHELPMECESQWVPERITREACPHVGWQSLISCWHRDGSASVLLALVMPLWTNMACSIMSRTVEAVMNIRLERVDIVLGEDSDGLKDLRLW